MTHKPTTVCLQRIRAEARHNKCVSKNIIVNETMGAVGPKSMALLRDVGCRIAEETGEVCARDFLFQRLSVAVQRGNCASVLGTITT